MIDIKKCRNSENVNGTGLDVSVQGMSIFIKQGVFNIKDDMLTNGEMLTLNIPNTQIDLDILDVDRILYIYLCADSNNPIDCVEEIGYTTDAVQKPIYLMLKMFIPAGTTDLSSLDAIGFQYFDIPEVEEFGKQPQTTS